MKRKFTPEQKEARKIVKEIEKNEIQPPPEEKNILKWTPEQLRDYVISQTIGMSPRKKLRFAKKLSERIKKEKVKSN